LAYELRVFASWREVSLPGDALASICWLALVAGSRYRDHRTRWRITAI